MQQSVRRLMLLVAAFMPPAPVCAQMQPTVDTSTARITQHCLSVANGNKRAAELKGACEFALSVQQKLPNYICDEKIKRSETVIESAVFRPEDGRSRCIGSRCAEDILTSKTERVNEVIDAQVTVEDGKDSYTNIRINGKPSDKPLTQTTGMLSAGEFGLQLQHLFERENNANFTFKKEVTLNTRGALLFEFKIREGENKSFNVWDVNDKKWAPGYSGSMWVDATTLRPIRLDTQSTTLRGYAIQDVKATTAYAEVPLADGTTFLLPISSSTNACGPWGCLRNDLEFTNCHKFGVKTQILTVE